MNQKSQLETLPKRRTYENIIVGNFLVGIGLIMGQRHANEKCLTGDLCVNLVQQTPLDKRIGDLLLQYSGLLRILEFKRVASNSTKETTNAKLLRRALNAPELSHLIPISRKIHWYVETSDEEAHLAMNVVPYLDLRTNIRNYKSLSDFVTETVNDLQSPDESDGVESSTYLKLLWRLRSQELRLQNENTEYGVLVLQLSAGSQLKFAAVQDIRHLFMRGEEVEAELLRPFELERQLYRESNLAHRLELTRDYRESLQEDRHRERSVEREGYGIRP